MEFKAAPILRINSLHSKNAVATFEKYCYGDAFRILRINLSLKPFAQNINNNPD